MMAAPVSNTIGSPCTLCRMLRTSRSPSSRWDGRLLLSMLLALHLMLWLVGPVAVAVASSPVGGAAQLCVLPLGDSLTQGVGIHGSYRPHLLELLQSRVPHLSTPGSIRFLGSHNGTCTPKKPALRFVIDRFDAPHEGHCSWNTRQLATHVQRILERSGEGGGGGVDGSQYDAAYVHRLQAEAAARYAAGCTERAVDVALLLIGHNDAFQAARSCRLREHQQAGSSSSNTAAVDDHRSALDGKASECVSRFLEEYERHLAALVDTLFLAYPNMRLVVGLNPTTNFPVVDTVVHQIILAVIGEHGRGQSGVATFDGWSRRHTFDSTPPNELGTKLMAEKWLQAMFELPTPLVPLVEPRGTSRADAIDDAEVLRRLHAATPKVIISRLAGDAHNDDDDAADLLPFKVGRILFLMFSVTFVLAVAVKRVRTSIRGLFNVARARWMNR